MTAKIAIDKAAFGFDRLFDYNIPKNFEHVAKRGCRVMVPFGSGNQRRQGIIFDVTDEPPAAKTKDISSVLDDEPVLTEELLLLAENLAKRTFCPLFEAVKAMLPPGLNYKPIYRYFACGTSSEDDEQQRVINWISQKKNGAEGSAVVKNFGFTDESLLSEMTENGLLKRNEEVRRKVGDETQKSVRLTEKI